MVKKKKRSKISRDKPQDDAVSNEELNLEKSKSYYKNPKWFIPWTIPIIITIILFIFSVAINGGNNINNSVTNKLTIQNSSVLNSHICQGCSNLSVTVNKFSSDDVPFPEVYPKKLSITNSYYDHYNSTNDLFNVKVILPTNQELYLPEYKYGMEYVIAHINDDFSDAYILHKYRISDNFSDEEVCTIISLYSSNQSDIKAGPKYNVDRGSCYNKLSGMDILNERTKVYTMKNDDFFGSYNLKYDLYNIKVIFPMNKEAFLPELLHDKTYEVAYSNEDGSHVYISTNNRIPPDFNNEEICFIVQVSDDLSQMQLRRGPKYNRSKSECYEMISEDVDLLDPWEINN